MHRGVIVNGKAGGVLKVAHLREQLSYAFSGRIISGSGQGELRRVFCLYGANLFVVPIDKMSILLTLAFSYFVFGEKLSKRAGVGLCLMTAGTLTMTCFG